MLNVLCSAGLGSLWKSIDRYSRVFVWYWAELSLCMLVILITPLQDLIFLLCGGGVVMTQVPSGFPTPISNQSIPNVQHIFHTHNIVIGYRKEQKVIEMFQGVCIALGRDILLQEGTCCCNYGLTITGSVHCCLSQEHRLHAVLAAFGSR